MQWDDWMSLTPEQCREKLRRYRDEIARERDDALASGYAGMNAALSGRAVAPTQR